jgi:hypothetical protein
LIAERFGLCAIEFHEDYSVGYDHIVKCLLQRELRFSIPNDFKVTEFDLEAETSSAGDIYRSWFRGALAKRKLRDLATDE